METHRAGTPSAPVSYGFELVFLGGSAHRARPGRCSSSLPLLRIAISKTAIRMKSQFSRISRCLGPGENERPASLPRAGCSSLEERDTAFWPREPAGALFERCTL